MIDNYERLVGRLMDLETKFYELQDKYQILINDYESLRTSYEKLKETHENCIGCGDKLGKRFDPFNRYSGH